MTIAEDGELGGPVAKNISDAEREGLVEAVGAKPGDCVFFAAGQRRSSQELLGAARNEIAKRLELIEPGTWSFLFVVDFPMFEQTEGGDWTFMHHPFTSPTPEWRETFAENKGEALSDAYDMVINGNELMSGSVRIHDAALQERVFETLACPAEEARERFGFFLEAFAYGPPPHAGAALGWDRLARCCPAWTRSARSSPSRRPAPGFDPLTGAPTPITDAQRTRGRHRRQARGAAARAVGPDATHRDGRSGSAAAATCAQRSPRRSVVVECDHVAAACRRPSIRSVVTAAERTAAGAVLGRASVRVGRGQVVQRPPIRGSTRREAPPRDGDDDVGLREVPGQRHPVDRHAELLGHLGERRRRGVQRAGARTPRRTGSTAARRARGRRSAPARRPRTASPARTGSAR